MKETEFPSSTLTQGSSGLRKRRISVPHRRSCLSHSVGSFCITQSDTNGELKYPTPEQDDNVGGGRALNKLSDPVGREVITINDDRWLQQLKKERQAIDECLDESGVVTEKIIQETYFKGNVGLRMVDLCDRQIIPVSTTKAYELRNSFLVELGKKLNVDVM